MRRIAVIFSFVPLAAFAQSSPTQTPAASQNGYGASAAARAAAANATNPQPDVAQTAGVLMQRNGGSLLRASLAAQPDPAQAKLESVSYFSVPAPEPRVLKKHDLVTIIVREESEFKSEGTTDLKRQADIDAKIEEFVRLNVANWALQSNVGQPGPEIKASANRNFKGEATVDRSDSLTMRIQAEVVDVKPNGTVVVQARAHVKTDEEEQTMVLSGTCRAEDVTPDNTVLSTQLHDKDVTKKHKGAVRDTTQRGWVSKLLDALRPF